VASERIMRTPRLPLTGLPLAGLAQLALLLMSIGAFALVVAAAPRGGRARP
jgi:hypothetical protein